MRATDKFVRAPLLDRGIDPAPRWTRSDCFIIGALAAVALALRIPGLDQGMWIDELLTLYRHIRASPEQIINASHLSNNHVVYSLLAHYAVNWLGESAWVIRLPAVVFGVAAIPALYHLGRQVAGREEAFLAALFMTLNYQFVWYAQSARGYTGLLFGAVLASILFIRMLATARPHALLIVGYAAVAALTVWMQMMAVFVILAHGICWLALACKPNRTGRISAAAPAFLALLLAGFLALVLYAPMFGDSKTHFGGALTSARVALGVEDAVVVKKAVVVEEAESDSTDGGGIRWVLKEFAQAMHRSLPGGWVVAVIVVFVLLTGIGSYLRQGAAIAGLLLLPALVTFLVINGGIHYFFPRYLFGCAGFLLLFAVRGGFVAAGWCLPFLSRRHVLLAGSLIALAGTALLPAAWKPKQDFVAAVQFIRDHRAPGDGFICIPPMIALQKMLELDCEPARSVAALTKIEAQYERVWLIHTLPREMKNFGLRIPQRIEQSKDYATVKVFPGTLNGGDVIVLLKQSTPPGASPVPDADR